MTLTLSGTWADLLPFYLGLLTAIVVPLYVDKRIYGCAELPLALILSLAGVWRKFYRETVELSTKHLKLRQGLMGHGRTKVFDLDTVRNFRRFVAEE